MTLNRFSPAGMATGIGSVPLTDPNQALELISRHLTAAPHWPQMPQRGPQEHFVYQFLQPLVDIGLLTTAGAQRHFDTTRADWPERLTTFYTIALAAEAGDDTALRQFAPSGNSALGFYTFLEAMQSGELAAARFCKGQIAGPLTIGFQLQDESGRMAYYNDELRDVIVRTLALNARYQARALARQGRPAIIFVDEPAISTPGTRLHLTLTQEKVIEDLGAIFRAISSENALAGVHSCEAADWSMLFTAPAAIVNLDTYRFGDSMIPQAKPLQRFLEQGGAVAWGIVPTVHDPFQEDCRSLFMRLEALWQELMRAGVDRTDLLRQSMITPACGVGLLPVDQARRIYELTGQMSDRLQAMMP